MSMFLAWLKFSWIWFRPVQGSKLVCVVPTPHCFSQKLHQEYAGPWWGRQWPYHKTSSLLGVARPVASNTWTDNQTVKCERLCHASGQVFPWSRMRVRTWRQSDGNMCIQQFLGNKPYPPLAFSLHGLALSWFSVCSFCCGDGTVDTDWVVEVKPGYSGWSKCVGKQRGTCEFYCISLLVTWLEVTCQWQLSQNATWNCVRPCLRFKVTWHMGSC